MAAALALLGAGVALGLWRFDLVAQMTDVMPEGPERDRMVSVLENFRFAGTVLMRLHDGRADDSRDPDDLVALADRVAAPLLEDPFFKTVVYRVAPDEQATVYEVVFPRRYYLLDQGFIARRTSEDGLAAAMDRTLAQLAGPAAAFTEPMLRADPLGFGTAALEHLLTGQQQFTVALYHGHFLSEDRRDALLIAEPAGHGMDVYAAERVLEATRAALDAALDDPASAGLDGEITGGPVYTVASSTIIRRDVNRAMALTSVGILALFLLFFGKVRVMGLAFTPPLVGVAAGVALLGLVHGGAHGLSLAFGAAMLGITVDYTIHLFTRAQQLEADAPRSQALLRTLREVTPSLTVGCLTTLAGFGALALADTQVLRDMSLMAMGGIATAFALSTVVAPLAFLALGGRRVSGTRNRAAWLGGALARFGALIDRRPGPLFALWAAVVAGLALVGRDVRFDGDIRNLDYQPPEVLEADERFQEAFGAGSGGAMIVVEGAGEELALQANDDLDAILDRARRDGDIAHYSGIGAVMPSRRTQESRLAALVGDDPSALIERVERAAALRGFVPGYFEPFARELRDVATGAVRPLTPADLSGTGIGVMVDRRMARGEDGVVQVLTLVETTGAASGSGARDASELLEGVFPRDLARDIERRIPGAMVISFPDLAGRLMEKVRSDLVSLTTVVLVGLLGLLVLYYRRPLQAMLALLPCLAGFACTAGVLTLLDVPLNIMNVCGVAITLGVSIDYGIFMVDRMLGTTGRENAQGALASVGTGVLMSSLTTILGLGTMMVARNPSMASMGTVVVFGVAGGLLTALVGVPASIQLARGLAGRFRRGDAP